MIPSEAQNVGMGASSAIHDCLVVGAGPAGLSCAISLTQRDLSCLIVDQGCIVNSLHRYPTNMVFFSTPKLIEIGGTPMTSLGERPVRGEALKYYRRVAEQYQLDIVPYHRVSGVTGRAGDFAITAQDRYQRLRQWRARTVVIAIGFYDLPVLMEVPGEDLPKVSHYYTDAHPYAGLEVAVVGGGNSAVIAALELLEAGARVRVVHRHEEVSSGVKYWLRPNFENRVRDGSIIAHYRSTISAITPDAVIVQSPEGERIIANDAVLALTGYRPDFAWLEGVGVTIDRVSGRPHYDPATYESRTPGLYLAGTVTAGVHTSEIFIENGRHHGQSIAAAIARRLVH